MPTDTPESSPREAHETLRRIRELMERPNQHSTFSGLSGVLAGVASVVGTVLTAKLSSQTDHSTQLGIWSLVVVIALIGDLLLTKRRAVLVGKRILSRLGKQMLIAATPGLGTGVLLTYYFWKKGLLADIYPFWMLCYGVAVCAVGLFSRREVILLGAAFLFLGGVSLLIAPQFGLPMMAITFGGLHIGYGVIMSRKDGW